MTVRRRPDGTGARAALRDMAETATFPGGHHASSPRSTLIGNRARDRDGNVPNCRPGVLAGADQRAILPRVTKQNYCSGDDYDVEFLGYEFAFNAADFEERVIAAAVRLGLIADNDLDDDETADLVELAVSGRIDEPRSGLGTYLVRNWDRVGLNGTESLVYWIRKLVFRGAWLDARVKEGLLEVSWDDDQAEFGYRNPNGDRALLDLALVPSWHEMQFRP